MIQKIIDQASQILEDYNQKVYKQGNKFNIYSLLGLEYKENETHSNIIADLLNPKGSHGQGSLFLEKFIECITNVPTSITYAEVFREYYIGLINENYTEGGRIDLLIKWNKHIWVIENKLYAKEQPNQIERYKNAFPFAKTLYLKVEKHLRYSNSEIVDYEISYEDEISKWLSLCIDQLNDKLYLQNSIKQYYNLVQNISKTGEEYQMELTIQNIIGKDASSLLAAQKINEQFSKTITELESKKIEVLEKYLLKNEFINQDQIFYIPEWIDLNIGISFEFDRKRNFYLGVFPIKKEIDVHQDLIQYLQNNPEYETGELWKIWKNFKCTTTEEYYNFLTSDQYNNEFLQEIIFIKDLINQFIIK